MPKPTKRLTRHDSLFEKAREAIMDVYADTTVDGDTTKESLEGLKDEIDILLDTLRRAK